MRIEVFPRRLAVVLTLGLTLAYLSAATALWLWLRRTPENRVGWGLAATAPFRWEAFRARRGDTDIAVAQERLRRREWGEAFFALRTGVARSPGNVPGRLALVALLGNGNPAQALRTLEEGLAHAAHDPDLLRALFALYFQHHARSRALDMTEQLLARQPALPPPARQVVSNARIGLLLERGDEAAAAALLANLAPTDHPAEDRRTLILRADLHRFRGRLSDARAVLATATPAGHPDVLRALAEVSIAEGNEPALESVLRRWRASDQDQPGVYLFAFQAWHRLGRATLRDRVEDDYFGLWGNREMALQAYAAAAAAQGLPEAVRRAEEKAHLSGFSRFAFRVHRTEIALRLGDFDGAFRLLREWEAQIETLPPAQRPHPEFINRLTRLLVAGPGESASVLTSHFARMRGRATPGLALFASDLLERAGHLDGAREIIAAGRQIYPEADSLRERASRLDSIVAGPLPKDSFSPAVPPLRLTESRAIALFDDALAAGRLVEARELLPIIRSSRPDRDPAGALEVDVRELHFALLTRDSLAARAAVRTLLGRHPGAQSALRLASLADALTASLNPEAAGLLRSEVAASAGTLPAVAQALGTFGEEALPQDAPSALGAIDAALRRGDLDRGLALIEDYRRRGPRWLSAAQDDLVAREVRLRLRQEQPQAALIALRGLVLRPGPPRAGAFALVRDLAAGGDLPSARLLAREIVRLLPSERAAASLLREVEGVRPAGT